MISKCSESNINTKIDAKKYEQVRNSHSRISKHYDTEAFETPRVAIASRCLSPSRLPQQPGFNLHARENFVVGLNESPIAS